MSSPFQSDMHSRLASFPRRSTLTGAYPLIEVEPDTMNLGCRVLNRHCFRY